MGAGSSNISKIQQSVTNNLLQQNIQKCVDSVSAESSDNMTIISGSHVGDVTGTFQEVNVDFSCNITTNMEQTISSILESISRQTAASQNDLLGGIQVAQNKFDLSQSVVNNMAQINQSICSTNTTASSSRNFLYITNSTAKNVVGVKQRVFAKPQCTINTITKMAAYNQVQGNSDQSSQVLGLLPGIFSGIAGIIILIIIGVIVVAALGAVGYLVYAVVGGVKKPAVAPGTEGSEAGLTLEQQINAGEVSPDELAKLEARYQEDQEIKSGVMGVTNSANSPSAMAETVPKSLE